LLDVSAASIHIRRTHYLVVNLPPELRPQKLDGTPYENTFADWRELCDASLAARELGLIDADRFVDRRAGGPTVVFIPTDAASEADIGIGSASPSEPRREIAPSFYYTPQQFHFPSGLPHYAISPPTVVEPYVIEIWTEKSTMNDILVPLARRLGATLITGVGELSLTHCNLLVERVLQHQRKTRILYISDFDPAGDGMPVSIARKIEHILRRDGHDDLDIRLDPLVLTAEQVEHYDLPRIPIKDSDRRKGQFEARHGVGAVELDALEAIHPGELARIVEDAVEVYREPTRNVRQEINETAREYRAYAEEIERDIRDRHHDEIVALRADFETMKAAIQPHQNAIRDITREMEISSAPAAMSMLLRSMSASPPFMNAPSLCGTRSASRSKMRRPTSTVGLRLTRRTSPTTSSIRANAATSNR
jgi:hypothetical protein